MSHGYFQGDVAILPLDPEYADVLCRDDATPLEHGRLILARGEVTGHHHSIFIGMQPTMLADFEGAGGSTGAVKTAPVHIDLGVPAIPTVDGVPVNLLADALAKKPRRAKKAQEPSAEAPVASMFRDPKLVQRLISDGFLASGNLCVGFLVVDSPAGAGLTHQEHDVITLPQGTYYVGMQQQMVGDQSRRVED